MERIAVFPGSFDPFTVGHESVVLRALSLFDKIIIAVGYNANKKSLFSIEQRLAIIKKVFENEPRIEVMGFEGLTVDLCKRINVFYILRGLRTSDDFEFERAVGQVNKAMNPEVESVYFLTAPEHSFVNSSVVREIIMHNGDPSQFIPKSINIKDFLPRL
jgi:pantetheine-phosphate adenylyltransferase